MKFLTSILGLLLFLSNAHAEIVLQDTGNAKQNRLALEQAIQTGEQIFIDAVNYTLDRPTFIFSGKVIKIRGRGKEKTTVGQGTCPFIIGIAQDPLPHVGNYPKFEVHPYPDGHHVDAFGILDSTFINQPNKWFGLRTAGNKGPDTVYSFVNGQFNNPLGKQWGDLDDILINLAYSHTPTKTPQFDLKDPSTFQTTIFGSITQAIPKPIAVSLQNLNGIPAHQVLFRTYNTLTKKHTTRYFMIKTPELEGVRKLDFYLNVKTGKIAAWFNGKCAEINTAGIGPDWPSTNNQFAYSENQCMKLGGWGYAAPGRQDWWWYGPTDMTFYALRLATGGQEYNDGPPDSPQLNLVSEEQTTDKHRYNNPKLARIITRLEGEAHPKDTRLVRDTWGYGIAFLADAHTHPYNCGSKVDFKDFTIAGGAAGMWVGGGLANNRFRDMRWMGGQDAFHQLITSVNYVNTFDNCTFNAEKGKAIVTNGMTAYFTGMTDVGYPATHSVYANESNLYFDYFFAKEASNQCINIFYLKNGGGVEVRGGMSDTEYNNSPIDAFCRAECGVDSPGTLVKFSNFVVDNGTSSAPIFYLDDVYSKTRPGSAKPWIILNEVSSWKKSSKERPLIKTNGPKWGGEVRGYMNHYPTEAVRVHEAMFPGMKTEILGTVNR
jgi:hypothetical protein